MTGSHPRGRTARRALAVVGVVALVAVLASCAAGRNALAVAPVDHRAGFWLGLWQGFIAPVTFLISLFTDSVSIYEVHNNGNWYDFGFMIGISFVFGSVLGPRRAARRRTRERSR